MEKQLRLLAIPLAVFLVCFSIVSVCNRFASDDFEFLNKLRDFGWLGSVKWFHEHWNTRWSAITILNGVLLLSIKTGNLWWYHLLCLFLLWYASFRITRNLTSHSIQHAVLFSGILAVAFFYSCFSIPDVFFWINTSSMYLLGIIAFLFAGGEITNRNHTTGSFLLTAFCGIFIGSAYEPLVFTLMISCIIILGILIRNHGWKVWYFPLDKKIILLLSGLLFGFAMSYLGEGHVVRASYLPQTTITFKLWVWIKAIIKIYFLYLPQILPAFLIGLVPCMIIVTGKRIPPVTHVLFKKITIIYFLLVIVSLLPVSFVMSEMGPERAWTQISLFTVTYSAIAGNFTGKYIRSRYNTGKLIIFFTIVSTVFILFTGISAAGKAIRYSKAYDKRMDEILMVKQSMRQDVLILRPLPDAGWLHSAELDTSESHFTNRFLKEYLGLSFDLKKATDSK